MARPTSKPENRQADVEELSLGGNPKRVYNRRNAPAKADDTTSTLEAPEPIPAASIEPQEKEAGGEPAKKFKPFAGRRFDRPYSNPPVDPTLINRPIPPAPMPDAHASSEKVHRSLDGVGSGPAPAPQPQSQRIAESIGNNTINPLEQQENAERAVDGALEVYTEIWNGVGMLVKYSESKLQEKHNSGKLNMHSYFIPPEYDARGRGQTVVEFTRDFNNQVERNLQVTDAFKTKIRPPLVRIAKKMGIGVSDEAYVATLVIQDGYKKAIACFQMKKVVNNAMQFVENQHNQLLNLHAQTQANLQEMRDLAAKMTAAQPAPPPQAPVHQPVNTVVENQAPVENNYPVTDAPVEGMVMIPTETTEAGNEPRA